MKNKIRILKYFELLMIFLAAMIIWYLADSLFGNPHLNNWSWIILAFSVFFVAWSLGVVIIRDKKTFLAITLISLLGQIVFTRSIMSGFVIIFSFVLLWLARIFIRKEMRLRLKVDIWNYLRVGRRFLVLAMALMIAGQYYFSNDVQIASENLPKLKFNHNQESFMTKVVAFVDPSLIKENNETISVDEFVINKFNENPLAASRFGAERGFSSVGYSQQEVILKSGRDDVSKMVERPVAGDEKMIDIFLEVINNKVDDVLNVSVGYVDKDMPVAHLIFTTAIFLVIMGSGMLASVILIFVVALIFRFLLIADLLYIDKKAVNMETIKIN